MSELKVNKRIKSLDDLLGVGDEPKMDTAVILNNSITADEKNIIQYIMPSKIRDFHHHPFRLYEGERLDDMIASVKDNGILTPVIIRRIDEDENEFEFEMLAGHNRRNAAAIAEIETIPCIVKAKLSDDEALIYVIETNVLQRSFNDLLPSEKAAVLNLRYSKMFSQGKRNDIINELKMLENPQYDKDVATCGNDCHKSKSRDNLGEKYDLSGRSVANYLRVNELIPELKSRLDNGELILMAAVGLSFLQKSEQIMVDSVLLESEYKVSDKKVLLLRELSGRLDDGQVDSILSGEKTKKAKSSSPPPVKIKHTIYAKYFAPDTKQSEIEKTIGEALAFYFAHKDEPE